MTDKNTMKIKCPHCKKTLTDDEIKIIWGQFVSSKTKGLTSKKKKKAKKKAKAEQKALEQADAVAKELQAEQAAEK